MYRDSVDFIQTFCSRLVVECGHSPAEVYSWRWCDFAELVRYDNRFGLPDRQRKFIGGRLQVVAEAFSSGKKVGANRIADILEFVFDESDKKKTPEDILNMMSQMAYLNKKQNKDKE